MLRVPNVTDASDLRKGDYTLMRVFEDTLIVSYSEPSQPPKIFLIRIKQVLPEGQTVHELLDAANLDVHVLEGHELASDADDEFG